VEALSRIRAAAYERTVGRQKANPLTQEGQHERNCIYTHIIRDS
jgi:hypothetical protein